MFTIPFILAAGLGATGAKGADFSKWCGKYYQYGAPMAATSIPYGFPYPPISSVPLLDFQCTPRSSFYLQNDEQYDPPTIIIDANITNDIGQTYHGSSEILTVVVSYYGQTLANGTVAPGSLGTLLPLLLDGLSPQNSTYNLTCTASGAGQQYTTTGALSYMTIPPWGGCGSKVDRLTGVTMVRNSTAGDTAWKKFFPIGFFDEIGQNSTVNTALTPLDRLYQAHANGMNMVHARPSFPPRDVFLAYLETVEQLGMYFTFDMSDKYHNLSYVQESVELLRGYNNLIGYYTGDEPDGPDTADNATRLAYDLIYELDGYHPVAVTLNCFDYKFIEYGIDGADQIMVDPYPVNLNGAFSRKYGTIATNTFGVTGCDDCEGSIYDTTRRVDAALDRVRLSGDYRTKQVWAVQQSFDDFGETFWIAPPTGNDVAVQMIVGLNHGISGIQPFDAPGSPVDAVTNASVIANMLTSHSSFFTEHAMTRSVPNNTLPYPGVNNMDIASWNNGSATLITAANFFLTEQDFLLSEQGSIVEVLFGNVTEVNGTALFSMPGNTVAGVIMSF